MDKAYIFETFKYLKGTNQKVMFLQELKTLNLSLEIRYDNLIDYYKSLKKEKNEE